MASMFLENGLNNFLGAIIRILGEWRFKRLLLLL